MIILQPREGKQKLTINFVAIRCCVGSVLNCRKQNHFR